MAVGQQEKATRFRALHARPGAFVIPNPWDAGSARILTSLGFEALATTSAGFAFSIGRKDQAEAVSRDETLANARDIVAATDLPVSADLEAGFGPTPRDVAETIRRAAGVGLVGGSIEDATYDPQRPIYDLSQAVERVAAAIEAARALSFPFTFTARAENFLFGRRDLDDTIRRLQAYEKAGADVLYAPGLNELEAIRTLCSSVSKPVNVVMGLKGRSFSVAELADAGVRRISVGSALCRAAYGALFRAAREMKEKGTFTWANDAVPFAEIDALMPAPTRR
ncbi:MAG TPA: isocitrate lyase/phosphoenolpyruvate mutase family protein [Alphaproteobacteria bacterium]|nr:isocitrate lyase/phosphoenolpyruvate mutase family protein [Alphaproteobacteria bacterium]